MIFMNKIERKYGRFAIKNLTFYLIATYILGFVLTLIEPKIMAYFWLEPYFILKGEVWRLITWIILPSMSFDFWTIIMLLFYYSIGRALERRWGDFRYNIYIFGGIFMITLSSFVLYFIQGYNLPFVMTGGIFTTYSLFMMLFFGFALTYPEEYVMLYFIIPIKMKWMALINGVFVVYLFIKGGVVSRTEIIAAAVNFAIFFALIGGFKALFRNGKQRPINRGLKKVKPTKIIPISGRTAEADNTNMPRHKCAVCGRTENDGEDLEFRYCSKCDGDYEYCQDHLYTHQHVKKDGGE